MQNKTVEFCVGGFILAGALALIYLAFHLSGLSSMSGTNKTYSLKAMFDNAGALKKNAKVTLSGVIIGKVVSVNLNKLTYMAEVDMHINSEINNLPDDSSVSIVTSGILGDKYIRVGLGGSENYLKDKDRFSSAQSAIVLEDLIGKFFVNMAKDK